MHFKVICEINSLLDFLFWEYEFPENFQSLYSKACESNWIENWKSSNKSEVPEYWK